MASDGIELSPSIKINSAELSFLARLIEDECGIRLEENKAYLFENRLATILVEFKCRSFNELHMLARVDKEVKQRIIEAITTKETFFFRDSGPFETLKKDLIPSHFENIGGNPRLTPLSIWSAACSTGQETYSIAIAVKEALNISFDPRIRIVGTDISDEAISKASYGLYSEAEISRGLPPEKLEKYFSRKGNGWRIRDEIRALVCFERGNILDPFCGRGRFDIIFCRNVAIYFAQETRRRLFLQMARRLNTNGKLLLGATEILNDMHEIFKRVQGSGTAYYQKISEVPGP